MFAKPTGDTTEWTEQGPWGSATLNFLDPSGRALTRARVSIIGRAGEFVTAYFPGAHQQQHRVYKWAQPHVGNALTRWHAKQRMRC